MPELPEAETMRRGVTCVTGSTIKTVEYIRSKLRPLKIVPSLKVLRQHAKGRKIESVGRVGKRVVFELDSDERIVIEPRMTGLVLLADPPDKTHLRLVFHLSGGTQTRLLFWDSRGLGVVHLLSPEQFALPLGPNKLGPDALEISIETLRARLDASSRAIKVALLDQHSLAGIGNLYASEILHRARLHPTLPCNQIRPAQWLRLHAAIREVLEEAIRHQGSTLADGTYRNAQNEAGGFQSLHRVYQRTGQRCLQCGQGEIVHIVQAQRSTFYCPVCQKPPSP